MKKKRLLLITLSFILVASIITLIITLVTVFTKIPDLYKIYPNANVILISFDTLRAENLGSYGYEKNTSPNLDKFASKSILFENAYSTSSWTVPGHFSLLTGLYPSQKNLVKYDEPDSIPFVPSFYNTLAEALRNDGYKTVGIHGGGYASGGFGFAQGFETYISKGNNFSDNMERISDFISTQKQDEKFFLFLHGFDVHEPYTPPENLKEKFFENIPEEWKEIALRGSFDGPSLDIINSQNGVEYFISQYDAELYYADILFADIMDQLKKKDLYDNTIIIVTSDHGEEFLEHGNLGHVHSLYQELIKVPLIIHLPNQTHKRRIKTPVSSVSVMPTILDLLGLPIIPEISIFQV